MQSPYPVEAIANALLQIAFDARQPVTHLKLQKLVYLTHGHFLVETGRPLVDEMFVAAPYGPVNLTLWDATARSYHAFRGNPIRCLLLDQSDGLPYPSPVADRSAQAAISFVWRAYGDLDDLSLSTICHRETGAWARTWHKSERQKVFQQKIPNDEIRAEFSQAMEVRHSAEASAPRA